MTAWSFCWPASTMAIARPRWLYSIPTTWGEHQGSLPEIRSRLDIPPGKEKAIVRFPRTCISDLFGPFNMATHLFVTATSIEVVISEDFTRRGPPAIYHLDRALNVLSVDLSTDFRNKHKELELEGKLKHTLTPQEAEQLRLQVVVVRPAPGKWSLGGWYIGELGELGHPFFVTFFLALSMSHQLVMSREVNHGSAAQQIRPGRTRRGVSLLQPVRPPGISVWIRRRHRPGLLPPQGMAGRQVALSCGHLRHRSLRLRGHGKSLSHTFCVLAPTSSPYGRIGRWRPAG